MLPAGKQFARVEKAAQALDTSKRPAKMVNIVSPDWPDCGKCEVAV